MDVHCILIEIFNGKEARSASSMLARIEDNTDYARTSTDIIFTSILWDTVMHVTVNMAARDVVAVLIYCWAIVVNGGIDLVSRGAYPVYVYSPWW